VSITPGDTAFTRTGASSSASARASDSSAPLAALTIAEFGRGRTLRKPVTSVSEPPGRMSASRATRQAPQNLPSIVARTSSIATVLNGPVRKLRGRQHDVIDGAGAAKQLGDALVAGHIRGNGRHLQPLGDGIKFCGTARGDDDVGALRLGQFRRGEADA